MYFWGCVGGFGDFVMFLVVVLFKGLLMLFVVCNYVDL